MANTVVIGADIGGSHITAAQVNTGSRQLVAGTEARNHVGAHGTVQEIMKDWSKCIRDAAQQQTIEQVCIAMPGPFDYEKGICLIKDQDKYPALYNLNVKELLAAELGITPRQIFLHNDAACFLQGEVFGGSMQKYQPAIGITLGTGLGSAVYKEVVAQDAGWWCYPFRDRTMEDYLSTRFFVMRWQQKTGESINGVKELVEKAKTDDRALSIFQELIWNLGDMLLMFIQDTSAQAVVIGGNIAQAHALFKDGVLEHVQRGYPNIVIEISQLGEKAALIGAVGAWYALRSNASSVYY